MGVIFYVLAPVQFCLGLQGVSSWNTVDDN